MSVSKQITPLSYITQKEIFQHLSFSQRKLLARQCPALIVIDDVVPYKLRTLKITYNKHEVCIEIDSGIVISWSIGDCFVVRSYSPFLRQRTSSDRCPVPMWKKNIFTTLLRKYIDRPGTEIDTIMINGFYCNVSMNNFIKVSNIHMEIKEGFEFKGLLEFLNSLKHWCCHKYGYLSLSEHHKTLMQHEVFLKMKKIKLNHWYQHELTEMMALQANEIWMADEKSRFVNPRISNTNYLTLAEFWISKDRQIGFVYRSAYTQDFDQLVELSKPNNWLPKFVDRQKCITKEINEEKEMNIYVDRDKVFNIRIFQKGTATDTLPPIPARLSTCRVAPATPVMNRYVPPKRKISCRKILKKAWAGLRIFGAFVGAVMLLFLVCWFSYTYLYTGYIFRCPMYRTLKQVIRDLSYFAKCIWECELPDYFEPVVPSNISFVFD